MAADGGGKSTPVFLALHVAHTVEDAKLGLGGGLLGGHGREGLVAEDHVGGNLAGLGNGLAHVAQFLEQFPVELLGRCRLLGDDSWRGGLFLGGEFAALTVTILLLELA